MSADMREWSVVRSYRNRATTIAEGGEARCRTAYKKAAAKLRAGRVTLACEGRIVAMREVSTLVLK